MQKPLLPPDARRGSIGASGHMVDVGNHWVLDSVQMTKVASLRRIWEMARGDKGMIQQKFNESQT